MRKPDVTKWQAVFSIVWFVVLVVGEWLAVTGINVRRPGGVVLFLCVLMVGLLMWWYGKIVLMEEIPPVFQGEAIPQDPLPSFYRRCRYWGVMLILSALTVAAVSAYRFALPVVGPPIPGRDLASRHQSTFTFPSVDLKILILNGTESSVLINGEPLRVGESAQGIRLIGVESRKVTLEFQGHTNVIWVPK